MATALLFHMTTAPESFSGMLVVVLGASGRMASGLAEAVGRAHGFPSIYLRTTANGALVEPAPGERMVTVSVDPGIEVPANQPGNGICPGWHGKHVGLNFELNADRSGIRVFEDAYCACGCGGRQEWTAGTIPLR